MLILFDIDATLIVTGGAGIRAMVNAGRELFGPRFTADGIDFAGRLDPLILGEMFDLSGVDRIESNMRSIRAAYGRHLQRELAMADAKRILPGVHSLIARLRESQEATLGLLTGNFQETGCMKLRSCGIEPDHFRVQVWGDDSPHTPPARTDLPPVGIERYAKLHGRHVAASDVTIIGDTPHDIACARKHGCRSLGVATGKFSRDDLDRAGADRVVENLADTHAVSTWLLKRSA